MVSEARILANVEDSEEAARHKAELEKNVEDAEAQIGALKGELVLLI